MQTATFDHKKRLLIPQGTPGAIVSIEQAANGIVTLTPMNGAVPTRISAKMVRKEGRLIFEIPDGYTLPDDAIAESVREERESL